MKKPTIALCMIIKNDVAEYEKAKNAIKSVAPFVDGIYLTFNGPEGGTPVAEPTLFGKPPASRVSYVVWNEDFSAARNFNFSQAKEDWILWIDADDVVKHP